MSKVLVLLAQGCEELEAVTVIDLLRRARIEVVTAGLDQAPVTASRGTVLVPDTTLEAVRKHEFDMVVLPGGQPGADHLRDDPRVRELLQESVRKERFVAAICAAPKVLAAAGLLDGRRATSFPGVLEEYDLPNTALETQPVVVDGKLITSRGPGTAMDFALELIRTLKGEDVCKEVEAGLVRPHIHAA